MTSRRRPTAPSGDPLAGVERVYIDGSNLLHALARGSARSRSEPGPAGAIIGRLRAAFPPRVSVDVILDGPPIGGVRGRLASGLRVAYSGRISADQVIDDGVAARLAADGPAATWGILVITDDRGLGAMVRAKGARTAGTVWLAARIGRAVTDRPRAEGGMAEGRRGPGGSGRSTGHAPRRAPGPALPKAGTSFGHRRPPRPAPRSDE